MARLGGSEGETHAQRLTAACSGREDSTVACGGTSEGEERHGRGRE